MPRPVTPAGECNDDHPGAKILLVRQARENERGRRARLLFCCGYLLSHSFSLSRLPLETAEEGDVIDAIRKE